MKKRKTSMRKCRLVLCVKIFHRQMNCDIIKVCFFDFDGLLWLIFWRTVHWRQLPPVWSLQPPQQSAAGMVTRTPSTHHVSLLQRLPVTHCSHYEILQSTTSWHLDSRRLNCSTLTHCVPPPSTEPTWLTSTGGRASSHSAIHSLVSSRHFSRRSVQTLNTSLQTSS